MLFIEIKLNITTNVLEYFTLIIACKVFFPTQAKFN
jgi:hypothetical protein